MKALLAALLLVFATAATADGPATPAASAGRVVDLRGSEIAFSVKQMGVPVSGRFQRFEAQLQFDPAQPQVSSARLSVDIASIDAGSEEANSVAVDPPWLDRAGFPRATFTSTAVRALGGNRYEARGPLAIKGRAREITVPFTAQAQPDGATLLAGQFTIRRADFGIGGGEWDEGDMVGAEVPITFRLRLAPPR